MPAGRADAGAGSGRTPLAIATTSRVSTPGVSPSGPVSSNKGSGSRGGGSSGGSGARAATVVSLPAAAVTASRSLTVSSPALLKRRSGCFSSACSSTATTPGGSPGAYWRGGVKGS